ncbi:hypothetical protein OQX61_02100 [Pedobacter sp. PLR]|uniref:hypothetical protein n=1 Tax=Pedobacter sp. PLR TaxID=2994465 RepID=UPI0022480D44|nr:hypothetical protein [Pedobacter sp. PLR]MCX2450051.1 hypothetical protein [Pedobacter sp. PLR]
MDFITEVIGGIKNFPENDDKKKALAIEILLFFIRSDLKIFKFTIKELADFASVNHNVLNQPYDTFNNSPGYNEALVVLTSLNADNIIDESKILSLLESTLIMMMKYNLIFSRSSIQNTGGSSIGIKAYPIVSSITPFIKPDDFFASTFEVTLSDGFWLDFKSKSL